VNPLAPGSRCKDGGPLSTSAPAVLTSRIFHAPIAARTGHAAMVKSPLRLGYRSVGEVVIISESIRGSFPITTRVHHPWGVHYSVME
jgi:hypothetical protein